MAETSTIEWTGATWNPVTGCSVVSPGCTNCYAMRLAGTRLQHHPSRAGLTTPGKGGPVWNGQVRLNEPWLGQPLSWTRATEIFVCAHGDLFHPAVPFEWIDAVFAVMALAQRHKFQVLTKRVDIMRDYLADEHRLARMMDVVVAHQTGRRAFVDLLDMTVMDQPLPNVWLGASAERQLEADQRRADLAAVAAMGWPTFVSYEPALGPVDWTGWEFLKGMIFGGESGPGARPAHPDWARTARDFAGRWDIDFFLKQWGSWAPFAALEGDDVNRAVLMDALGRRPPPPPPEGDDDHPYWSSWWFLPVGKKAAGRTLDGVEHNALPWRTVA